MTSLLVVIVSCVLLQTSLEMIFLLEVIVFLFKITYSVKSTYIKDIGIESTYITSTYIGRAYTRVTCISNTYTKDPYTRVISDKDAYIGSVYAIEYLEMHLQSFWILEIGGIRLEIQVEASYANVEGAYIGGTCIADLYTRDLWVGDTCTYVGNTCIKVWDTSSISIIKG